MDTNTDTNTDTTSRLAGAPSIPLAVAPGPPGATLRAWTWAAAMREIESILSWVLTVPDAYVTFALDSRWNRFVQARGTDDGRLFVETTDEVFTDPEPYDLADLVHIVRLGWRPQAGCDQTPNWWREADPRWLYAQPMMAELMVRTLVEVHRATGPADIVVRHGTFTEATREPGDVPEGDDDEWL